MYQELGLNLIDASLVSPFPTTVSFSASVEEGLVSGLERRICYLRQSPNLREFDPILFAAHLQYLPESRTISRRLGNVRRSKIAVDPRLRFSEMYVNTVKGKNYAT